jgi:hypothetical protein
MMPADDRSRAGDQWAFVAIDAETKVGKRDLLTATCFDERISPANFHPRVQISPDALRTYIDATERAFGGEVDYGQAGGSRLDMFDFCSIISESAYRRSCRFAGMRSLIRE